MTRKIAIVGTGHFGTALANYLQQRTPNEVVVASRSTETPPQLAVQNADIVILATPSYAYQSFVPNLIPHLSEGSTVIDASNIPLTILPRQNPPPSAALSLRKMLPDSIHVAKALNTIAAIRLTELAATEEYTKSTLLAFASDERAVKTVQSLINEMGFTPDYKGDLSAAENVEQIPHTFFPSYKSTLLISAIIWMWWILYSTLSTYVIHGGRGEPSRPWDKYPLSMFMATTGETANTLFAITFLAGPVATMFKAFGKPLGKVLIEWLDRRKQLGLCAFMFVSAHGIAGAISASHLDDGWRGQIYFVFGILSYIFFTLLAVCSSGSTAATLSWAEFRAVFSWLGTAAFALGIIHVGFWGGIILQHVPNPSYWVGGGRIMPIYWLGMIFPIFVILMRFITWMPCVISAAEKRDVSTKSFNGSMESAA